MTVRSNSTTRWLLFGCTILAALFTLVSPTGIPTQAASPAGAPISQAGTFLGGYRTVEGMSAFLDQQAAAHPTLAQKVDFGDSWCKAVGPCPNPAPGNSGYDLLALRITNQAIGGPKPVYWFDAGIHGHEIVPPELAMRFISWLLDNYETNADARWLVDYTDIWVVPIANPDGHHITEAVGPDLLQRKNGNPTGCNAYPPTVEQMQGVDLNRNFPYVWGATEGSSPEPCSQLYRGPSPASEPETQAIVNQMKSLIADQRGPRTNDAAPLTTSGFAQSMHSIAQMNLMPWQYTSVPAPNRNDLRNIVAHVSATDAGGNGYRACQTGVNGCLGGADGSTMDWIYGELGIAAMTTEIGNDSFTPPYSEVESLWNTNAGALVYQAKIARAPYLLTRGPDALDVRSATLVVDAGSKPVINATINYRWTGNTYFQNVGGAEMYVDTPPWAGGTAIPMVAQDGALDSGTEAVLGTLDTSGLSLGKHVVFVRGRGVNSYEGQQSWGPVSAVYIEVVQSGGTPVAEAAPTTPAATPTAGAATATPPTAKRTPLAPPVQLPTGEAQLFPQTGKTVFSPFLEYWTTNGGLAQQGYPISDLLGEVSDLNGQAYTMQYFERAVFEYHPENAGTPYEILLSQLGTFRYRQLYPDGAPGQVPNTEAGSVLFEQTGRRVGGLFLDYWNNNGGLAQQGYPISDEFTEVSALDGKPYKVQYFERAVFEYHPENAGTPYEVLLSQLGTFRYREIYGNP